MGELEMMMKTTVRWILKLSIDDYLAKDRNEWVLEHPGQCVLNGSQVHWTSEVEDAITNKGLPGVVEYYEKLDEQLIKTVSLVRGQLTNL
mmetsp:Transcript_26000/g.4441  ORF Transcript_26000/g.4441 Transcript_26000/m.4441 type:complete len:90 (-) Transcript_26000:3834-4103(-)